jgi:hypothetical protein
MLVWKFGCKRTQRGICEHFRRESTVDIAIRRIFANFISLPLEYYAWVNKFHYDEIPRLKWSIHDTDQLIHQYAKSARSEVRTAGYRATRRRLKERVRVMEEGWAKIIPAMRAQSASLFALPREIRERIYGHLYTLSTEMVFDNPDPNVRYSLLPRDPYHYLSTSIVHPVIAAEAAQTLYDTNRISIQGTYSQKLVDAFLTTDHFGSGVCPGDIMRRLKIYLNTRALRTTSLHHSHAHFEEGLDNGYWYWFEDRAILACVLDMPELRLLEITTSSEDLYSPCEWRVFNPIIKQLLERGVAVRVKVEEEVPYWETERRPEPQRTRDVSEYFRTPAQEEREIFGDQESLVEGSREIVSVEGPGFPADDGAYWRVFLDNHYHVWKAPKEAWLSGWETSEILNDRYPHEDTGHDLVDGLLDTEFNLERDALDPRENDDDDDTVNFGADLEIAMGGPVV